MPRNWKEEEEEDIRGRIIRAEMSAKRRKKGGGEEEKMGAYPKCVWRFFNKKISKKAVPKDVKNKRKFTLGGEIILFLFFHCMPIYAAEFYLTFGIPPVLIWTRKRKRRIFLFSIKGESCVRSESLFFSGLDVGEKKGLLTKNSFPPRSVACSGRGGGVNPKRRSRGKKRKKKGKWGLFCSRVSDALFGAWDSTYLLTKKLICLKNGKNTWTKKYIICKKKSLVKVWWI